MCIGQCFKCLGPVPIKDYCIGNDPNTCTNINTNPYATCWECIKNPRRIIPHNPFAIKIQRCSECVYGIKSNQCNKCNCNLCEKCYRICAKCRKHHCTSCMFILDGTCRPCRSLYLKENDMEYIDSSKPGFNMEEAWKRVIGETDF